MFNCQIGMNPKFMALFVSTVLILYIVYISIKMAYLMPKSPIYKCGFEDGFAGPEDAILKIADKKQGCSLISSDLQIYSNGYMDGVYERERQEEKRAKDDGIKMIMERL